MRIGVAYSDADGIMAMPIKTVQAGPNAVSEVLEIIHEYQAKVVYVGSPINMAGQSTKSTESAHDFANHLAALLSSEIEVRLIDERLSTVSAQRRLHSAGKSQKASRNIIDQAAAVIILEQALEIEKNLQAFAGTRVGESDG